MTDERRGLEFVYTPLFLASARGLFSDEALRQIEITLLVEPQAGDVIQGAGGIRKLRAPLPARGKSGGARIIYLFVDAQGRVYMLLAYGKNTKSDLSAADKKTLRALVKDLRGEP